MFTRCVLIAFQFAHLFPSSEQGLGLGDSLISVVAHDFEMRLSSDQRDAPCAPGDC